MQAEQLEILEFLRAQAPLRELPEEALQRAAAAVDVRYFRAGAKIVELGQPAVHWHLVRSGAVEVFRRDGSLYNRLGAGGHFGEFGLLRHKRVRFPVVAIEDSLIYQIPEPVFTELFENHDSFADAVEVEDRTRLRHAVSRHDDANAFMASAVESLIARAPVMLDRDSSALDAARRMGEENVSSLLVTAPGDTPEAPPRIAGILTDRDLRIRLLAPGLAYDTPVREVMTDSLVTLSHEQPVFEAMQLMLRHNVHHLPVLRQQRPIGVVALSDIIRQESRNSVFVVGSIFRQNDVGGLAGLVDDVHACFTRMAASDTNSRIVGAAMAAIGRGFKQRLLELAEAELGPPPVPYALLALGSMARQEQLIVTDQDNALVLDDGFDPERHGAYFETLAARVCDGLARCGYPYCSGGVMASNPRWRQPLREWQRQFDEWIDQPSAEGLLHGSIFFDLDAVAGRADWVELLRERIARRARASPRFLACMARNALLRTPPLGFFKGFVMESDGRHENTVNLKRRGTAPLVDLVRVHALAIGSTARNSFDRIDDIIAAAVLPPGRGRDLQDALEFISSVRIRHQAADLDAGVEPGNSVEPDKLAEFDRKNLRDAFLVLDHAQQFLKFRYQPGRAN